ncbi:MAG: MoxR family ATPase, partial [Clostridia bacterium]|nr:MoxR family ATPase [Clostridia bacterium]
VLADEINRATPKTQSALLESMQEHKVTVMGTTRQLDEPFFVLATQNPIEQDGTYPLPEAQMDRFMLKLLVPDPSMEELIQIVDLTQKTMDETADVACTGEELLKMREVANQIPVADEVMRYAMILTSATHPDSEYAAEITKKYIRIGSSPRAGQALISCGKVMALIKGRFNVSYNDINEMALPVLRHRIKLNFEAVADRVSADDIIIKIVDEVSKKYKGRIKESGEGRMIYDPAEEEESEAPAGEGERDVLTGEDAPQVFQGDVAAEDAAPEALEDGSKKRRFGRK